MSKLKMDEMKEQILLRLLKGESLNDLGDADVRHAAILELGQENSIEHGQPITMGARGAERIERIPNVRLTPRGKERAEEIAARLSPPS